MNKKVLTVKEAAEKLNLHPNTVRAMAEDGRLPGVKTKSSNGHWRFSLKDVEALLPDSASDEPENLLSKTFFIKMAQDTPSKSIDLVGEECAGFDFYAFPLRLSISLIYYKDII